MKIVFVLTIIGSGLIAPCFAQSAHQLKWTPTGSMVSEGDIDESGSLLDEHGYESWFLLRTSTSRGPISERTWLRDGRYVPLGSVKTELFGAPLRGAIFQTKPSMLAPFVAGVTKDYTIDCTMRQGEVILAPGPDHAVILGWRSPFDGKISVEGTFNNRQTCCGVNSQVNWSVERGPAPDTTNGFHSEVLANGVSDDAVNNGISPFEISNLSMTAGDWIYFTVDARADGSATPHHGDATVLELSILMTGQSLPPPPEFEKDIRPILMTYCGDCHGSETDNEAKLDLRTVAGMIRGGESGSALVPGQATHSYLWTMVGSGEMPPSDTSPLPRKERAMIRRWIEAGAPSNEDITHVRPLPFVTPRDREHWAFQRPVRPPQTTTGNEEAVNPVDAILLRRLEQQGLGFSPVAPDEVLVRRLYFDLIGLPPTPRQIDDYLRDRHTTGNPEAAWSRLVDQLLDHPGYGERWGRHWMDAAGYVDVRLYDGDATTVYPNEGMWRYRDYIIQSFNDDKPWDQFLQEQLAGDEMVDWKNTTNWTPDVAEKLIATGFLRNIEDHTSEPQYGIERRYEVLYGMMSMVSTNLLGLTFECARCHNHKYDPISQRDYYRLMAIFESSYNVHNWLKPQERWIPDVGPKERTRIDQHNAAIAAQIKKLETQVAELDQPDSPDQRQQVADLRKQIATLGETRESYGKIQALFDVGTKHASRVLRRGDCFKPGRPVVASIPEILTSVEGTDSPPAAIAPGSNSTSGRRLALARWITSRANPLTARVIMNRLWMHHFGSPIVATPGDFGRNGARPTHPELLDWLAVEFQENRWSLKHMHRLVLNSRAWRQASRRHSRHAETIDPANSLFWRQNLNRLESEIIRDSVLAVSGQLDAQAFGPPVSVTKPVSGLSMVEPGPTGNGHNRRSIYLFTRRIYPLKFLEIFDSPIMAINCTRRLNSTTVLQSFAQVNSEFMITAAQKTSERILEDAEVQDAITFAWRTVLGRAPQAEERLSCEQFLAAQTEAWQKTKPSEAGNLAMADLCHMLLCTNEFLYVE